MTVHDALILGAQKLTASGVPDAKTDAEYLLSRSCGQSRWELLLNARTKLTSEQERLFSSLLFSRMERIPLQYLLGEEDFFGLTLHVDERVLIPRPETELLCEAALEKLRGISKPFVLDLCTGSGAIALALAKQRPDARIFASDISRDALHVARLNGEALGLTVQWFESDLFESLPAAAFHAIVSNPPYIPTEDCLSLQEEVRKEPLTALDGGADGLDFYHRMISEAPEHLLPDGFLLMECGSKQTEAIAKLLHQNGFVQIEIRKDLSGLPRMVIAQRKEEGNHAAL